MAIVHCSSSQVSNCLPIDLGSYHHSVHFYTLLHVLGYVGDYGFGSGSGQHFCSYSCSYLDFVLLQGLDFDFQVVLDFDSYSLNHRDVEIGSMTFHGSPVVGKTSLDCLVCHEGKVICIEIQKKFEAQTRVQKHNKN